MKLLKYIGIGLLGLVLLIVIAAVVGSAMLSNTVKKNYGALGPEAPTLQAHGIAYRDLNKNGTMDIYEDPRAATHERVTDLLGKMSLEEKAGMFFVSMIGMADDGKPLDKPTQASGMMQVMMSVALPSASEMLVNRKMNSFNILDSYEPEIMARFNNNVQKIAERTRLGIPVTIASDPRHDANNNPGAMLYTPSFSQWPTPPGLAATRDTNLVREFGDIARREYLAVGIRLALSPMADLGTEPRWARLNGTFGEDAHLAAQMTKAFILGFQGDTLSTESVGCMTKHFSGGGPQADGEDAHFPYGKDQVYPGGQFDYHVRPFVEGAFPAHTAQIMPYYGIPQGQTNEDVAFGFNRDIITGLLRDSLGFDGVVCTDWLLLSDTPFGEAHAWGVEALTPLMRAKKVLDAGCDQFGGEARPDLIIQLVEEGHIAESRLDVSVARILRDKFTMGLFDDPYVDAERAGPKVGLDAYREKGKIAQAKSAVLLKNDGLLPLAKGTSVYLHGLGNTDVFERYAEVVSSPEEADVVIATTVVPHDPRSEHFLERFFLQGRLHFSQEEMDELIPVLAAKPSVVVANLSRPAVLTEIHDACDAMIGDLGLSHEVIADLLFGERVPEGQLPFALPSTWESVLNQQEDVPFDLENPLFAFGYGMRYEDN